MRLPTAHQVQHPAAGWQQAAVQGQDGGVGPAVNVVDQPRFFVKAGVIPVIDWGAIY
jgi:hypothetical protein